MSEQDYHRKLAHRLSEDLGIVDRDDEITAALASEGVVDPETFKAVTDSLHDRTDEVERLEEVIADIGKAASERRQRIRDGWSVEFDRETGHELWTLDDPPLAGEKR